MLFPHDGPLQYRIIGVDAIRVQLDNPLDLLLEDVDRARDVRDGVFLRKADVEDRLAVASREDGLQLLGGDLRRRLVGLLERGLKHAGPVARAGRTPDADGSMADARAQKDRQQPT